jgi:hypothetical protein
MTNIDDLDRVLWGAEAIGREANVVDDDGQVKIRATYYLLEKGLLPANKIGGQWASTPRRIRARFAGPQSTAA